MVMLMVTGLVVAPSRMQMALLRPLFLSPAVATAMVARQVAALAQTQGL